MRARNAADGYLAAQRPNNDDNDPDNDRNDTAENTGLCLADSLEFLRFGVDLFLGHDTQNDRDGTEDNPKKEQSDDAAHHGGEGHAAGLGGGIGWHGRMTRGDGGGLGRLGHVADDAVGGDSEYILDCGAGDAIVGRENWGLGGVLGIICNGFPSVSTFGAAGKATQLPYHKLLHV